MIFYCGFTVCGKHAVAVLQEKGFLHSLQAISSCLVVTSLLRPGLCFSFSTPRHPVVHLAAFDRSGWCVPFPRSRCGRACIDFVGCAEDPLSSSDRYRALKPLVTPALPWSPWLLLLSSPGLSCLWGEHAWLACQRQRAEGERCSLRAWRRGWAPF